MVLAASALAAEDAASLLDLDIEDLMRIKVVTHSLVEENLFEVPVGVTVITGGDITRYGTITLPDALRYVPGLHVAQQDASTWAISARGFNAQQADKQQVLIDGRSVFNPLFSGVIWDMQPVFMEDVERIEVIRGPGSSIWGSNAVNGVLNVITKDAFATLGGEIYGGIGDPVAHHAGARYGFLLSPETAVRVQVRETRIRPTKLSDGTANDDETRQSKAGLRVDSKYAPGRTFSVRADFDHGTFRSAASRFNSANATLQWRAEGSDEDFLDMQLIVDGFDLDGQVIRQRNRRADLRVQHARAIGERHLVNFGLGARLTDAEFGTREPRILASLPDSSENQLFYAHVQDDLVLVPDQLRLLAGVKWEHDDFAGSLFQPTLRLSWRPDRHQTVWVSATRAVATPSITDRDPQFVLIASAPRYRDQPTPGLYVDRVVGNPEIKPEHAWVFEAGYRREIDSTVLLDLTAYWQEYENGTARAPTGEVLPGAPVGFVNYHFDNTVSASTYGVEVAVTYRPGEDWDLHLNYTERRMETRSTIPAVDMEGNQIESFAPRLLSVLASWRPTATTAAHTQLRYLASDTLVDAYWELNAMWEWEVLPGWRLELQGKNLLHDRHAEAAPALIEQTALISRGFFVSTRWDF